MKTEQPNHELANQHIGSDFEDFLAEENLLDNATVTATDRAAKWQSEQNI